MRALLKEIAQYPLAMAYAVLVHVVLALVLLFSLSSRPEPLASSPKANIVQAVAVDEKQVQAELAKLKKAEELQKKKTEARRKAEEQRKQALERKAREAEKKRRAEERRLAEAKKARQAEVKRKQALEQQRKAEEKRLAAEKARRQQEVARIAAEKAALEKKRQAEEKRLAELAAKRKAEEAERKRRVAAEAKRKAEEAKRKAEEERQHREREAAMRAEIAAEQARLDAAERQRLDSLRGQYVAAIAAKVERNWIKPPSARPGLSCEVRVRQIPGGEVIDVQVSRCTGDETFHRSVETAVRKASPLPIPQDPRLFEREIIFDFKPR